MTDFLIYNIDDYVQPNYVFKAPRKLNDKNIYLSQVRDGNNKQITFQLPMLKINNISKDCDNPHVIFGPEPQTVIDFFTAVETKAKEAVIANAVKWFKADISKKDVEDRLVSNVLSDNFITLPLSLTRNDKIITHVFNSQREYEKNGIELLEVGQECSILVEYEGIRIGKTHVKPYFKIVQILLHDKEIEETENEDEDEYKKQLYITVPHINFPTATEVDFEVKECCDE